MVLIKIYDVGVGNYAGFGMYDGDLRWSSQEYSGYKHGIIDVTSLNDVVSTCNVVEVGTVGGVTSPINLLATCSELVSFIDNGDITLAGKQFEIYYKIDSDIVLVYTGIISTIFTSNQITTEISVNPLYTLDTKIINSITVTQEMALNNAKSEAIGKTLSPVYGNTPLFPLIYCDPSLSHIPIMTDTTVRDTGSGGNWLSTTSSVLSSDGYYKGLSLLQVSGMWQQTEDKTPLWITLSINGKHSLFDVEATTNTDKIRNNFINKQLIGIVGSGKSEYFRITDIEYTEHNGHSDIWLQLDTNDSSKITASIPYVSGDEEDATGNGSYRIKQNSSKWGYSSLFTGAYEDNLQKENVTVLSLASPNNIFLVHGDCDVPSDATLYIKKDQGVEVLENVKVTEIYAGVNWKMVSIVSDKLDPSSKNIVDTNMYQLSSIVFSGTTPFNGCSYNSNDVVSDGWSVDTSLDTEQSKQTIIPLGSSAPSSLNIVNCSYTPINQPIDNINLADGYQCSVIPNFSASINGSWYGAGTMTLTIGIDVMSEGSLIIGTAESTSVIYFNKPVDTATSIDINPIDEKVYFSAGCTSYELESATFFKTLKSQLDITEFLQVGNANKIRALMTRISIKYTGTNGYILNTNGVFNKTFSNPFITITKNVNFDEIYLKSSFTGITSPVSLIKYIAEKNGIICDNYSFTTAEAVYSTILSEPYNGYYATSGGESVSTILQNIAKMTSLGLYTAANGVLYIKQLLDAPSSTSFAFTGDKFVKDTFMLSSVSTPCSSYNFNVNTQTISNSSVQVNVSDANFPAETDYELGEIVYDLVHGWSLWERLNIDTRMNIRVRGPVAASNLLYSFAIGTMWRVTASDGVWDCELQSTGIDPSVGTNMAGVWLGMRKKAKVADTTGLSIRMRSPIPKWRTFVNGVFINDYITANSLYDLAQDAYVKTGKLVEKTTDGTSLTQPIFGDDVSAIQKWMFYTVRNSSQHKITATFDVPITNAMLGLGLLGYVSVYWSKYYTVPCNGYIIQKSINFNEAKLTFTVLLNDVSNIELNYILTELSVPILTETNQGIIEELADPNTGVKISDMGTSSVNALITAGGVVPVAVQDINNFKVTINDLENYAINISKAYTDSKISSIKHVVYAGDVGDTSITFAHGMPNDDIIVSVYNRLSGTSSWVPVEFTVDETNVYVNDLLPLEYPLKFVILS